VQDASAVSALEENARSCAGDAALAMLSFIARKARALGQLTREPY
jgi:hypothetical protein